jgi:hypothetical protein
MKKLKSLLLLAVLLTFLACGSEHKPVDSENENPLTEEEQVEQLLKSDREKSDSMRRLLEKRDQEVAE